MALRLRRGTNTERQLITPLEGELIYTTDNKELWVGDGSTQGGLRVTGTIPSSINDLDDVDIPVTPSVGQILKWDGGNFVPSDDTEVFEGSNYRINIVGDDSSIIVNTSNNTITGNLIGNVTGDIIGSVFGDDSSTIIDGVNNTVIATNVTTDSIGTDSIIGNNILLSREINDDFTRLDFTVNSDLDLSGTTSDRGRIYFSRNDVNGKVIETSIGGGRGGFFVIVDDDSETLPLTNIMLLDRNGNFSLGTVTPSAKLTVAGDGAFDDSLTVGGFVQFGSYTDTERSSLTASNGMIIYNTTSNKFQGYQGGSWINLDDGSSA